MLMKKHVSSNQLNHFERSNYFDDSNKIIFGSKIFRYNTKLILILNFIFLILKFYNTNTKFLDTSAKVFSVLSLHNINTNSICYYTIC